MSTRTARTLLFTLAVGATAALSLAGCASTGGGSPSAAPSAPAGGDSAGVEFNQEIHDLLPADIRSAGTIQLGVTIGDPPYMDKVDGEYVGLIPDLADAVGTVMGVDFEYVEMPFPGLIPALQSERIQAVWTSMFDNADREQVIDMASYARASMGIIVQKGNPKGIEDLDDLCGTVAGTTKGTVQEATLVEQQKKCQDEGEPELTLKLYATQNDAYTQAQAGVLDSVMLTYTPMNYQAGLIEDGNAFDIIDWTSPAGYLAVGASNLQDGLAESINAALLQLAESGDYQRIMTEHGADADILDVDLLVVNGRTSGVLE
ncbi:transporter substrate-binding domain-containing protein [Microbacterium immunditiarum]|uniref:Polar amino acid transport system substrate-binding protein n=1 Tax=Microbacterium immunditiarum TaxID=337480 RepID=A0A7Y9GT64_9MICO|nr:transporter substrate-binding domain-containing protein [Microbacterium immunditiarum]NYE21125.1 polar amino acid transport system substrate-binding protein [Microbacterium immunditiarum]